MPNMKALIFESAVGDHSNMTNQMNAIEQYFPVVLFIMPYMMTITFKQIVD